jgi:PAS domain S-box-containing protein
MILSGGQLRHAVRGALARLGLGCLSARAAVHLAFALAAVVLLFAGWTLYDALQASRNAARWVGHTQDVVHQIGAAREHFAQTESAQRGYLLSGADGYLAERDASISALRTALQRLAKLTADNPDQQQRVADLDRLATERINIAMANAQARRLQGFAAPWPETATQSATGAAGKVYQLARRIEAQELALLARRQEEADERQRSVLAALAAALVIALVVLAPAYAGVLYQSDQRMNAERRMSDLVEHLPLTAWQIRTEPDGTRRFVFVSKRVLRDRGLLPEAVTSDISFVLDSIVEEDRVRVQEAMARSERTLEGFDERYRVRMPAGEPRWIHSRAALRREHGGGVLWSGYWADITREKKLEEELVGANQAMEAFSYSVSHDLRAPLASIDGFSKALAERSGPALDTRGAHYLSRIRAATQHMGELIEGMLLLGQVSRVGMSWEEVDLSALAALALAELREREPARRVAAEIEPGLTAVGDPRLLRQVVANLVGNAWKFTAPRSEAAIRVGMAHSNGQRCFCVRDNGVGFDMAYAGKLFAPFQRLHSAGEFPGSGVGLATVQRVVARHGGTVWIESAPEQGTSAFFTLPAEPRLA